MPITLNHSNIGVQYSTGSNYIIETVKSDLYRKNEIVDTIVRDNIQVAPVTPIISIQDGSNVYAVESYTYSGSANTADFTRVFTKSTTCDILIVGGGGGGGGSIGGGGGGGSVIYATNITIPTGSYSILVGKGGSGGIDTTDGTNGFNTVAFGATAVGGGRGGDYNVTNSESSGGSGGGEGGGMNGGQVGIGVAGLKGSNTIPNTSLLFTNYQYYVNDGGLAFYQTNENGLTSGGGGGGGAGTAGGAGGGNGIDTTTRGVGGDGVLITVTGTNVYYGAGGGGSGHRGTLSQYLGKLGGLGGGGDGGNEFSSTNLTNGSDGTGYGAGGGGGAYQKNGGKGGSGIVIIRYLLGTIPANNLLTTEPVVIAPSFTESIRTFIHSGGAEAQTTHTITVGRDTICDILIVGGGGGGGNPDGTSYEPGGGGAGGVVYMINKTLNAGTYKINVGKGGASNTNGNNSTITYFDDNNITFDNIQLIGRGGGKGPTGNTQPGSDGGSGGGGGHITTNGGLATQGNTFWNGTRYVAGGYNGAKPLVSGKGGGGGGAGEPGDADGVGFGGDGVQVNITGTNTFYAGGGNAYPNSSTTRSDGGGGTLNGSLSGQNGGNALPNTGSGGAGAYITPYTGGSGGSGIVIIKFKSTTPILEGITHKRLNFGYNNDNLVAWYKFNGDYFDSSGNGHNLTNVGTVIQSTHIIEGQAVEFDSTDYLEFPATINPYTIWNGKGITFSCWIRFTAHETWARLIDFQTAANTSTGFYIAVKSNWSGTPGAILVNIAEGTLFTYSNWSNSIITTLGVWHHFVWSIDVAGKWDVYLNNVRINNTETRAIPNITYNVRYINRSAFTSDGTWDGQMDDFRIYDRAFSAADVARLYNKTYPAPSNTYTLNFPVPTIADINNNSNIVLRGAYDIALSTSNALIIPKEGQHIHNPSLLIRDSSERIYPPVRNFTTDTTIISGQTYGNGTYIVSSSTFNVGEDTFRVFNGTNNGWTQVWPRYEGSPAGTYSGLLSLGGFTGEWIKVQFPVSIKLTRYIIEASATGGVNRAPSIYKIFGSNNNIDWEQVVYKSVPLVSADYISSKYEEKVSSNNYYRFFALVIGKNIGLDGWLSIGEWYIYGQEFSNNSLSIRYNILNPILDPIGAQWTYSSSNTNVYHMGSVGIGTTRPEYQLDVRGPIYSSVGGYTQTGLTTWTVTSDKRIKDNIVRASYDKCLENVKNIELYNFNFKNNCVNTNDKHQLGFIAQEVQQVYPKAVEVGKMILNTNEAISDILTLNTTQIDYTLYGAVKNLIEKIEDIDNDLENIEKLI